MSVRVWLPPPVTEAIGSHVEQAYPLEGCGFLFGRASEGSREAVEARPARNARDDSAHDRYEIEPAEVLSAEREVRSRGLEIVGFYHSHPDARALPSGFDRDRAWPWYAYVIVPVERGRAGSPRAWLLDEHGGSFVELDIRQELR